MEIGRDDNSVLKAGPGARIIENTEDMTQPPSHPWRMCDCG